MELYVGVQQLGNTSVWKLTKNYTFWRVLQVHRLEVEGDEEEESDLICAI